MRRDHREMPGAVPDLASRDAEEDALARLMLRPPDDLVRDGDALTPAAAADVLEFSRADGLTRWRRLRASVAAGADLRGWADRVSTALGELSGVGTLLEVAAAAAGTPVVASPAYLVAYGATRALVEEETVERLAWRRCGRVTLLASASHWSEPDEVLTQVRELGHVVLGLCTSEHVVPSTRLQLAVTLTPELELLRELSADRLSRLAAHVAPELVCNRRGELYPRRLTALAALTAVATTTRSEGMSSDALARRVRARFPEALPLTATGAELDELYAEALARARARAIECSALGQGSEPSSHDEGASAPSGPATTPALPRRPAAHQGSLFTAEEPLADGRSAQGLLQLPD